MAPTTIFRIASQTKAITSAAMLALHGGREAQPHRSGEPLHPDRSPTRRWRSGTTAPGVAPEIVPAKRPITIRDLLTHTAGISYGTDRHVAALYEAKGLGPAAGYGWYTADKDEPICDTMERLGTLPFVAQPGEAWVYGYNTDILGCIVETRERDRRSTRSCATRITGPLGMKDTQFFLPPDQRDRLAAVYTIGADGKIARAPDGPRGQGTYVEGPRRELRRRRRPVVDGARLRAVPRDDRATAARSTASASSSPRTVALMTTNQIGTLHSPNGLGFGLGFETTDRYGANGLDSEGAFGWSGAYSDDVPRRSRSAAGPRADDPGAAEHDRHRPQVPDAGLSGAHRSAAEDVVAIAAALTRRVGVGVVSDTCLTPV